MPTKISKKTKTPAVIGTAWHCLGDDGLCRKSRNGNKKTEAQQTKDSTDLLTDTWFL